MIPDTQDVKGSALFEQWASVEYSQFYGVADAVLAHKLFNPQVLTFSSDVFSLLTINNSMRGIHAGEYVILEAVKKFHEKLDVLNQVLADQQYLGGPKFSLIDIFYMPAVDLLFKAGEGPAFEGRPNLGAWWARVSNRDSWKHVASA